VTYALRTPKAHMLGILALLLLIAAPTYGITTLLPNLAAAVVAACLIDTVWLWIETKRLRWPTSALLSALFVFAILSTDESWLVVGWTSAFAVIAKRIVRTDREQIFNPAALALVWAPIAFGSGESWWGALSDLSYIWVALLLVLGIWLVERLNKFPLVLSFLLVYFGFFSLASVGTPHAVAEMFREPFVQASLFLAFFMLTDPPTSPNRYGDQIWFGALTALCAGLAQLWGAGQVYLLLGLLFANAALAVVRWWRRRAVTSPRLAYDAPAWREQS
jgi:Na+-translocating ferredoxin:NAD+ oxidoreductase RnfD subunit